MATVHPFPGVPHSVDYRDREEDSNHPFILGQDLETDWSASHFQAMSLRTNALNDLDGLPETVPYRHAAGISRCMMETPEQRRCSIDAPHAWQNNWNATNNPLPYTLDIPHEVSSRGQWTRIDQDTTISGGSTWSPKTSDSRSEADTCMKYQVPQHHEIPGLGLDYATSQGPMCFPQDFFSYVPRGNAGISPQDIHKKFDPENFAEDVNMRPELHEIAVSEPYSPEEAAPYSSLEKSDRFGPEDEALGSSIQDNSRATSIQDDDDSAMGDSPEVDDDDDYNPRAERRSHARRLSHKSATSRNPTLAPKRPQRTRNTTSQTVKPTKIAKKTPKTSGSSPPTGKNPNLLPCAHCSTGLTSESALKKHVLASHTRPFICTFHKYGCSSTVGSKNEWKRHINVQHMHLETWRCDVGVCAPPSCGSKEHKHSSPSPSGQLEPHGSLYHEFDRKDLFTQHLKRMHAPAPSASRAEKDRFEKSIEETQKRCHRRLRDPPSYTICPYCPHHPVFDSWDDRVEHVGKHLERSDFDKNQEIEDDPLREWLSREGYLVWKGATMGWRLLDTGKKRKNRGEKGVEEGEEDAEGDDED